MTFYLSARSLSRLVGVHPDLVIVVCEAIKITRQDFTVFEGVRSLETQREYVERGVSWTMNSRHLTGHAVDLVPWIRGGPRWEDKPCRVISEAVKEAADKLDIKVEWGMDLWGKDGPHYQLPWNLYPV